VLPTSAGKSLCFQTAAICLEGITIVVTPIVSLIRDQVTQFNKRQFSNDRYSLNPEHMYKAIYPGMNNLSNKSMFEEIIHPEIPGTKYKLLYISPESLQNPRFIRSLQSYLSRGLIQISHIAIDEVHCMSQWGYEFRESYLSIPQFIDTLSSLQNSRPIISAFTATATNHDILLIKNLLGLDSSTKSANKKFRSFFFLNKRENLNLNIINIKNASTGSAIFTRKMNELQKLLEKHPNRRTVIYCTTTVQTRMVYQSLLDYQRNQNGERRSINMYTGKAQSELRTMFDHSFQAHSTGIMVATKAYGMGINIDDIELVIHFDMPLSIDDYYQEVGRGARDKNRTADCYLLYASGSFSNVALGTLHYNMCWITDNLHNRLYANNEMSHSLHPIISNFSESIKDSSAYWKFYRLVMMWYLCEKVGLSANKDDFSLSNFVINYFSETSPNQKCIKSFYTMLRRSAKHVSKDDEKDIKNSNDKEAIELATSVKDRLEEYASWEDDQANSGLTDILKLLSQPHYLNINNTKLANQLRWHSDSDDNCLGTYHETEMTEYHNYSRSQKDSTLYSTDITDSCALIHIRGNMSDSEEAEYVNHSWNNRSKNRKADLLITVKESCYTDHVYKRDSADTSWLLTDETDPSSKKYAYPAKSIQSLFPKYSYTDWYRIKENDSTDYEKEWKEKHRKYDSRFVYTRPRKEHSFGWKLEGSEPLNYFDMCVADAVYTLELHGDHYIRVQNIWQLLTGDDSATFSRKNARSKLLIEQSIEKMRTMHITIDSDECSVSQAFMPLTACPGKDHVYSYDCIPPLYAYAEALGGQFIRVPRMLFNVKNNKYFETQQKSSVDWVIFSHYLLHRLAIAKHSSRGNFIRFSTLAEVLDFNLRPSSSVLSNASIQTTAISKRKNSDKANFFKLICIMLSHYRQRGYIPTYYVYFSQFRMSFNEELELDPIKEILYCKASFSSKEKGTSPNPSLKWCPDIYLTLEKEFMRKKTGANLILALKHKQSECSSPNEFRGKAREIFDTATIDAINQLSLTNATGICL